MVAFTLEVPMGTAHTRVCVCSHSPGHGQAACSSSPHSELQGLRQVLGQRRGDFVLWTMEELSRGPGGSRHVVPRSRSVSLRCPLWHCSKGLWSGALWERMRFTR